MVRSSKKHKGTIVVDGAFLESYGQFILDESLWDCFRLYYSWIEPLVVNQWILEMQRFSSNQERGIALQTYHDCLVWIDKDHDTRAVRKRVEQLRSNHSEIISVWSGSKLRNDTMLITACRSPTGRTTINGICCQHLKLKTSTSAIGCQRSIG